MSSRNRLLYVVALLLACACVVRRRARPPGAGHTASDAKAEQERYGDVLASARAETEAFINIDYRKAQESIDAVAAGATGEFKDQYTESVDSVIEVLEQNSR